MGKDLHALLPQILLAQAARDADRRGQTAGIAAAAGEIHRPAVFHKGRVVRVRRTRQKVRVVRAARVRVADDRREGVAAGSAVVQAAQKFRRVCLAAARGKHGRRRRAAVQKRLQFGKIRLEARRKALKRHADGRPVGFAENRQLQSGSDRVAHGQSPFVSCVKSFQKPG